MTTSCQISCHYGPLYSTKNDSETLHSVIEDLRIIQNIIYEFSGIIGHKVYSCIICCPNFLPPSLRRKMNQFNSLHGDEPTDPPIECNIQPPPDHFKYRTSPPKTIPVVSSIMGRLNHIFIHNGYVEVHPS